MPDLIISATGIGATLLACGLAIVLVVCFQRVYKQQSAAVRDGKNPRYVAYKKLATIGARLALLATISSLLVVAGATLLLSAQTFYPRVFVFVGIALCVIVAPCMLLPRFLFDFLALIYVDLPALAEFQGTNLTAPEEIALSLRGILFGQVRSDRRYQGILPATLSSFLLLEATGILFLLNFQSFGWVIPVLAVALRLADGLAKNLTLKWVARIEPLERTSWDALAARIRQFAERLEVGIGDINVHTMTRAGSTRSLAYGLRRPALLLSDIFLKNTDWRQQDAMIALVLILVKKRASLVNMLFSLAATALFWIFLVAFSALIASVDAPVANSTALTALYSVYIFFILLVVLWIFYMSKQTGHYRLAMDVTGDPLAVLAVIHTLSLLAATPPSRYTWQSRRMRRLEQLARKPGPRVPWANRPVPSLAPLNSDSPKLTIPLEHAPPPEPVADVPYPESTLDVVSLLD